MSKPIKIKFTWSKELALKASKIYYDWDMKNSSKRYIGWLFVGLVQFGMVGALKHNSFGILFVSTFLVIYWYYGRWYLRKGMLSRFYDKQNLEKKEIHFEIDKNGFKSDSGIISWNDIIKVIKIENEDDILIQTTTNTLYFDKESFESLDDMNRLISLAKKQGKI